MTEFMLEAFIPVAKHVEVQIIGDGKGNYVHLGERDCSVQRKTKINRGMSLCRFN